MAKFAFELEDVHFSYLKKFPALCGVNFGVPLNQKIAVIGANGSGKSTLLHLLDGLLFPDKGKVKFLDNEFSEKSFETEKFSRDFRCKVGLVFQNPDVQLFCPTVEEDIVFGPLQLGIDKKEIRRRLERVVVDFGLTQLLTRPPHQLSVGEKRKVAIASVLVIDPEILLLDEPTAGLDPSTTRQIIDIIIEANAAGKTIITSTHDLHIIEEIADNVYVFSHEKKIIRSGPPEELLRDQEFLERNNLVHIHRHKHKDKVHVHPHYHLGDHHEE